MSTTGPGAIDRVRTALNLLENVEMENSIVYSAAAELREALRTLPDLLEVATFLLRGIEGGHVKCAPYFDFDPDAAQVEFKHPIDMLRAAIASATAS